MASFVEKTRAWLLRKLIVSAVIAGLGFGTGALWIFSHQRDFGDLDRETKIVELSQKRAKLRVEKAEIERRMEGFQAGVAVQRERSKQAEKVIASLHEDESWWDRVWANRAQQKTNDERLERMEKLRAAALAQTAELTQTLSQTRWEKDGVEISLQQTEGELAGLEASQSKLRWFAQTAWEKTKWFIAGGLGAYFFGPLLWTLAFSKRGRSERGT